MLGELEIKMRVSNNNTRISSNNTLLLINNLNNKYNSKIVNFLHFKEEEYKLVDMNFIKLLSIYYFIYNSNE